MPSIELRVGIVSIDHTELAFETIWNVVLAAARVCHGSRIHEINKSLPFT